MTFGTLQQEITIITREEAFQKEKEMKKPKEAPQ
jgi:hypothetical protein